MLKRIFDLFFASGLLFLISPVLVLLIIIASIDTASFGIFTQIRVGQHGNLFKIYKIKTIRWENNLSHISFIGKSLRKYKLDELPQLFNIIKGDMSVVGPRPDIQGYYDLLTGKDRDVLILKPGLTSEASIKYRNEEDFLNTLQNPIHYNDTVIFPDKVKMNLEYSKNQSFLMDLNIIIKTIKSFIT